MKQLMTALGMLAAAFFLVSCAAADGKESEADYQIYYVNKEGTALSCEGYDTGTGKEENREEPSKDAAEALAAELLEQMDQKPESQELRQARPDTVALLDYSMENQFLYLNYSVQYLELDAVTEVLYRAAVVKTLTQIPGVEGVFFQVNDAPLTDGTGNVIGVMTADSFVDNTGDTINAYKRDPLTLYFASEDGSSLKREQVDVVYSSNVSMEKLVMEQLIAGPQAEGYKATLPSDVTILNIRVTDGTCYVHFDEKLQNIPSGGTEDAVIYSVVNSLTELSTIRKVQISVNGRTDRMLRESRSLDKVYERNLELVLDE